MCQSVGMKERATTCVKELSEERQEAEQRNMSKLCNCTSQETGILECLNKICQDLNAVYLFKSQPIVE